MCDLCITLDTVCWDKVCDQWTPEGLDHPRSFARRPSSRCSRDCVGSRKWFKDWCDVIQHRLTSRFIPARRTLSQAIAVVKLYSSKVSSTSITYFREIIKFCTDLRKESESILLRHLNFFVLRLFKIAAMGYSNINYLLESRIPYILKIPWIQFLKRRGGRKMSWEDMPTNEMTSLK